MIHGASFAPAHLGALKIRIYIKVDEIGYIRMTLRENENAMIVGCSLFIF